ncbi:MAG: hypothetical protein WBA13_14210 [Microcoleaceae cyanobacterium]
MNFFNCAIAPGGFTRMALPETAMLAHTYPTPRLEHQLPVSRVAWFDGI